MLGLALAWGAWLAPPSFSHAAERQLIVAIAPNWNAQNGVLRLFERSGREPWRPVSSTIPVLFGKNGLAWGRGVASLNKPPIKREKDGRAPAGIFELGKIYTHDRQLPPGSDYPFHRVTDADAWIDDPNHPLYNQHVVIDDPRNPPPWFEKQRMRLGDAAYRWLIDIKHNRGPIVPGAGSAIFFHIRRGPTRPTHGCTTMEGTRLAQMISWLRMSKKPRYALLPEAEYHALWKRWDLPEPRLILGR